MNIWFRCKGCGQPAAYFGTGLVPYFPPKTVAHSKPRSAICMPVQCALYQRCTPEQFWELHQDAERLAPPTEFQQVKP